MFGILLVVYVSGLLTWAGVWAFIAFDQRGEDKAWAYHMLFSSPIWPLALIKIVRDDYLEALEESRDH